MGYSHWTRMKLGAKGAARPKKGYASLEVAEAAMHQMYDHSNVGKAWSWSAYKCGECPNWHIGRKSPYAYISLELAQAMRANNVRHR